MVRLWYLHKASRRREDSLHLHWRLFLRTGRFLVYPGAHFSLLDVASTFLKSFSPHCDGVSKIKMACKLVHLTLTNAVARDIAYYVPRTIAYTYLISTLRYRELAFPSPRLSVSLSLSTNPSVDYANPAPRPRLDTQYRKSLRPICSDHCSSWHMTRGRRQHTRLCQCVCNLGFSETN